MPKVMRVRRQGNARILTLPATLLERIGADFGTPLSLSVRNGALIAKPVPEPAQAGRRRYTLDELLEGAEHLPEVYRGITGSLDGSPVGDELA